MSEIEETASQRQARIRRERREAKIKTGGADRLDKITRLSGRTPELARTESPSPAPSTRSPGLQPASSPTPPLQPPLTSADDSSQIRAQEDFLRQMLRAQSQPQNESQQEEDPMIKMLQSIMGGGGGDPSDPNAPEMPSFSPDDISKATGIPSFVTSMFLGKPPETEEQKKQAARWKIIHALFSILIGLYTVWSVRTSIASFGAKPPAPATFQNPFILFVMGELLVEGGRLTMKGIGSPKGIGAWYQLAKDIGRDGGVVIFFLGICIWLQR